MKTKKDYRPVTVAVAKGTKSCTSKHSKGGAGCKTSKNVPCRVG